jgi:hypothetical protein
VSVAVQESVPRYLGEYRMFLLPVPQALHLYSIEGLHSVVLTVTAALLREMITETDRQTDRQTDSLH